MTQKVETDQITESEIEEFVKVLDNAEGPKCNSAHRGGGPDIVRLFGACTDKAVYRMRRGCDGSSYLWCQGRFDAFVAVPGGGTCLPCGARTHDHWTVTPL